MLGPSKKPCGGVTVATGTCTLRKHNQRFGEGLLGPNGVRAQKNAHTAKIQSPVLWTATIISPVHGIYVEKLNVRYQFFLINSKHPPQTEFFVHVIRQTKLGTDFPKAWIAIRGDPPLIVEGFWGHLSSPILTRFQ